VSHRAGRTGRPYSPELCQTTRKRPRGRQVSIHNATNTDVIESSVLVNSDAPVRGDQPIRPIVAIALMIGALVFGAADGYVAFVIESPGTSLAGHSLLVAAIPVVVAAFGWLSLRSKGRKLRVIFATSILIAGFLATWWAWAFAMPAAMTWDNRATLDAVAATSGIPPEKSVCVQVTSGAIGPLSAPYRRCALTGPPGSIVEYFARGSTDPTRGLIFDEGPAPSDECVRHLTGHWYAFTNNPSGMIGYTCRGGG
jgi:hypothetical protein